MNPKPPPEFQVSIGLVMEEPAEPAAFLVFPQKSWGRFFFAKDSVEIRGQKSAPSCWLEARATIQATWLGDIGSPNKEMAGLEGTARFEGDSTSPTKKYGWSNQN